MKSRVCLTPLAVPFQPGYRDFTPDFNRVRRQRRLLLGVSLLLILCWVIAAVWLIGVRRGERNITEALLQQRTIAALFSEEL